MSVNLHDYQESARNLFFDSGKRGTFLFATGTGKTEIAIGIIERYLEEHKGSTVLFIAPRINLVEQTHERMAKYGLKSGMYYSEDKNLEERVTISTYQSMAKLTYIVENFDLIVFDEVHLASDYAEKYSEIMKLGHEKDVHMLCLTATLDQTDPQRYGTILETCPVLDEISLNSAIKKNYLSALTIEDHSVDLVPENRRAYTELSNTIKNISDELGTSNPREMSIMLRRGQWQAGNWFKAVQARKLLMEYNDEKINKVKELIDGFNGEQTIVFCERVPTLEKMKEELGDKFEFISAKTGKKKRKEILENFGKTFSVIGTVHTLDLGYDVPDIKHGIVVASNKNETTIVQRIGRVVRKAEGKTMSKIYVIYAKGTHEHQLYGKIREAVQAK